MDLKGISPSLRAFIEELEEYDKLICDAAGKASERKIAEKRKEMLIQNFVFGNDGKSILEALLFIKSQVAFGAGKTAGRRSLLWIRLWREKAEALYEKAKILIPQNTLKETAYTDIIQLCQRAEQAAGRRSAAGGLAVLFVIAGMILWIAWSRLLTEPPKERETALRTESSQAGNTSFKESQTAGAADDENGEPDGFTESQKESAKLQNEPTESKEEPEKSQPTPVELPVTRKLLKGLSGEDTGTDDCE